MFDPALLLAAGVSFVAGLVGYLIVRLWVKPIAAYINGRRKVNKELACYLKLLEENAETPSTPSRRSRGHLQAAKRQALALTACYAKEIPYWYRLLLDSRGESPTDASGLLTNLSKIDNPRKVKDRIERARKKLGLL